MPQEQCDMCQRKFDSDSMSDVKPEFRTYDISNKLCMRCTSIYLQLTNVIHSEWIKRGQLEYYVLESDALGKKLTEHNLTKQGWKLVTIMPGRMLGRGLYFFSRPALPKKENE